MTDNTIYLKLSKIQSELKAPKDKTGVGIKYSYRSCEGILEAVKPLLGDTVIIMGDEIEVKGDRHYVKATATFTDGVGTITNSAFAREPLSISIMSESQVTGAASSYARKYALSGLLALDDNKDADDIAADGVSSQQNTPKTVSNVVSEESCPKCGSNVIEGTTKTGKTYVKCSKGGWDSVKGIATGCSFIRWETPISAEQPDF